MESNKKNTKVYLTKKVLVQTARAGIRKAAKETVRVMGYNVIALNGWVVKKYPDGTIERIKELEPISKPAKIILD